MDILNIFITFVEGIFSLKIFDNVSILDLLIYSVFLSSVILILKISIKGKK